MTFFTEVDQKKRSFKIEFAVANIKYNILGAPFLRRNIQNIVFQQNIMTYKEQHPKLPIQIQFSTFTEKDYPYISYIYHNIKCKEPIHFKPRSGKTIHFPIKEYPNLHFELEDTTKFLSNPYTHFSQKFKDIFHFLDMIVNDKSKDSRSTVIQNFTSHAATLPRGIIGYIEIIQTTPPHYRV